MGRKSPVLKKHRLVNLDLNTTGAWKAVGTYDLDSCDIDAVLDAGETLVRNMVGKPGVGKLRVTLANAEKTPLMYWDHSTEAWTETRHAR